MRFLNLVRWPNLLLIIIAQCLIRLAISPTFNAQTALNLWQFFLLVGSTVTLAAAGNIINDIYDVQTDSINKPNRVIINSLVSESFAYNLFIVLNVIGVGLGFYLSHAINKPAFFSIFVIISATLYMYASYLKGIAFIGNVVIAILVALTLIIVGLFDLIPAITIHNQDIQRGVFQIILAYAGLAFLLNLSREIIKDIEDINGDYTSGLQTLPILIGRQRTAIIASFFCIIALGLIVYYVVSQLYNQPIAVVYYTFFIIGPLIYIVIQLFTAKSVKNYKHISQLLKLVMLTGLLSLCLYPLNLC